MTNKSNEQAAYLVAQAAYELASKNSCDEAEAKVGADKLSYENDLDAIIKIDTACDTKFKVEEIRSIYVEAKKNLLKWGKDQVIKHNGSNEIKEVFDKITDHLHLEYELIDICLRLSV